MREIARLASDSQHRDLDSLLLRHSRREDAPLLEPQLRQMRDRLLADARERGWEVDR